MAASQLVASDDVEDRNGEEADSRGDKNDVEHIDRALQRCGCAKSVALTSNYVH